MKYPILYKKNTNGSIQQWETEVVQNTIITKFGIVNGKIQTTVDVIKIGKNLGKVSETSIEEQALKEGRARWLKQKKKRYVENIDAAREGEVDTNVILGGYPPMLSINQSYPKDPILDDYLEYPCYAQYKLDGACCMSIIDDGKCTLWSRTQKPVYCLPHIVEELEKRFPTGHIVLHSESYNHEYRNRFEDLMSIIRKNEPDPEGLYKDIQLHVYDTPECHAYGIKITNDTPYEERLWGYQTLLNGTMEKDSQVLALQATRCENESELLSFYESALELGYEGAMAKNAKAPYKSGKRSRDILKMKEFTDGEFKCISIEDGKGGDAGIASKLIFEMSPGGPTFSAARNCPKKEKLRMFNEPETVIGWFWTVTYKRLTAKGVPYICKVKTRRDYE